MNEFGYPVDGPFKPCVDKGGTWFWGSSRFWEDEMPQHPPRLTGRRTIKRVWLRTRYARQVADQTLRDLLNLAVARHGYTSVRQLAVKASDRGHKITAQTLNSIRAGTYKFTPSGDTLRAISWLAGVHEDEAYKAAGLRVPGPPLADELPPGVDALSPEARSVIIDLCRYLIKQEASQKP